LDDLLATGGTTKAVIDLVNQLNGQIIEASYLIELVDLGGAKNCKPINSFSILKY
jgi:adenine phosphoribosyltransferase|tara:strand:- start:258 stop:422 length:165 start_codon:yes stop_codon:yes gene_type:complete